MPNGEGTTPGQASLDGQGATEPISQTKEHRYIYYRLYTKDGPLESNNPIFSNDLFLSRISSKLVRPPHTAASLKRCLCKLEGFEGPKNSALYLSLSGKMPLEDSARVSLRGNSGSGLSELDPVVLVADTDTVKKRSKAASQVDPSGLPIWQVEQRYVYYRLYDEDSGTASKASFDENDSTLGRISTFSIPPPHTVASLKNCLVNAEGVSSDDVQLLENEDGEITMNDSDGIALLTDNFPGFKENQPIVFTYALKLSNQMTEPELPFSKRLTVTSYWDGSRHDPTWHSLVVGEILQTNGISRAEPYTDPDNEVPCYVGINSSGKKAFVPSVYVTLS